LAESTGTVQVDGAIVGSFTDYDGLIEAVRARIDAVGVSQQALEECAGLCEGALPKYLSDLRVKHLSISSLLQIAEAIGVRAILVEDPKLLRRMKPLWSKRDARRIHARRRALGPITLKRILPAAAAEMGRRGAQARNAALGPETRRKLAQAAARARWQGRNPRS
jgi:hypothetical protein